MFLLDWKLSLIIIIIFTNYALNSPNNASSVNLENSYYVERGTADGDDELYNDVIEDKSDDYGNYYQYLMNDWEELAREVYKLKKFSRAPHTTIQDINNVEAPKSGKLRRKAHMTGYSNPYGISKSSLYKLLEREGYPVYDDYGYEDNEDGYDSHNGGNQEYGKGGYDDKNAGYEDYNGGHGGGGYDNKGHGGGYGGGGGGYDDKGHGGGYGGGGYDDKGHGGGYGGGYGGGGYDDKGHGGGYGGGGGHDDKGHGGGGYGDKGHGRGGHGGGGCHGCESKGLDNAVLGAVLGGALAPVLQQVIQQIIANAAAGRRRRRRKRSIENETAVLDTAAMDNLVIEERPSILSILGNGVTGMITTFGELDPYVLGIAWNRVSTFISPKLRKIEKNVKTVSKVFAKSLNCVGLTEPANKCVEQFVCKKESEKFQRKSFSLTSTISDWMIWFMKRNQYIPGQFRQRLSLAERFGRQFDSSCANIYKCDGLS